MRPNQVREARALGTGLRRPILAYLLTLMIGVASFLVLLRLQQGGEVTSGLPGSPPALLGWGLTWLIGASLLMLPAFVSTVELVHRFEAASTTTRSVLGAASWAGWALFMAAALTIASHVALITEWLAQYLLLFGAGGVGFAAVAFDDHSARAGRALIWLALAMTAFVILGSLWMAGRWGAAA